MSGHAPASDFFGSEAVAVCVGISVLVLQWFLISFSAVRALDSLVLSAIGAMAGQMRRWVARSTRAAERMTDQLGLFSEFDQFSSTCAAMETEIKRLSDCLPGMRFEELTECAEHLRSLISDFTNAEIAFVNASRSACVIVEQPGQALCETEKIRARVEATWLDYMDLCGQRQSAARRMFLWTA
jgi:hypothetical protein